MQERYARMSVLKTSPIAPVRVLLGAPAGAFGAAPRLGGWLCGRLRCLRRYVMKHSLALPRTQAHTQIIDYSQTTRLTVFTAILSISS